MAKDKKPYAIMQAGTMAQVSIIGNIGWWKNSSDEFTSKITELINAGITDCTCYINSLGGSVFDALEIYNQFKRFTGNTVCEIGALCGSAATVVALSFKKVKMMRNGLFMIHNPTVYAEGGRKEMESMAQLYDVCRANSIEIYVGKTGLSETKIGQMMDATTWMNSATTLKNKFIDQVIDNISVTVEEDVETPSQYADMLAKVTMNAGLFQEQREPQPPVVPPIANLNSPLKMNKPRMIAALMLSATASDDEVTVAIERMAGENATMKIELAAQKKLNAKMLIDTAIESKKITESERDVWQKDAEMNYDITKRAIDRIPAVVQVSQHINHQSTGGAPNPADFAKMSFSDRMKADEAAMMKMRSEDPKQYGELYKAEYGEYPSLK